MRVWQLFHSRVSRKAVEKTSSRHAGVRCFRADAANRSLPYHKIVDGHRARRHSAERSAHQPPQAHCQNVSK
jgi:hypothetical protein